MKTSNVGILILNVCCVAIRHVIQVLEGDVACGCLMCIVTYRMNLGYQNSCVFRYCASHVAANTAKYIAVNYEHNNVCNFAAANLFIHYLFMHSFITILLLCEFVTGSTTNVKYYILLVSLNRTFVIKATVE
jgi:hypothetical protein